MFLGLVFSGLLPVSLVVACLCNYFYVYVFMCENKDYEKFMLRSNIDREFVTSAKKFANFNEFSEIKKIR